MKDHLRECEKWLRARYVKAFGAENASEKFSLNWVAPGSLSKLCAVDLGEGLCLRDEDVGGIFYFLPFEDSKFETLISQALRMRSRLQRQANFTGAVAPGPDDDAAGSWRICVTWIVSDSDWSSWQNRIQSLRRETGAAEELTFDVVRIATDVSSALDDHGLPRLLFNTRLMLSRSIDESERWLSADVQVVEQLKGFSAGFSSARARALARQVEDQISISEPDSEVHLREGARQFTSFSLRNFRNLEAIEIETERAGLKPQAIVIYGPNGTGKSSLVEAISLAAFKTSPRLEQFVVDKDLSKHSSNDYLSEYIAPISQNKSLKPSFRWGELPEAGFELDSDTNRHRAFEGTVLNQEDSLTFTQLSKGELASLVLKGYSESADRITAWIESEDRRMNDVKKAFTQQYGISSSIKRSATAYDRLANILLQKELKRPPAEFLDWLDFISRTRDVEADTAGQLLTDWRMYVDSAASRLAATLAKMRELGSNREDFKADIQRALSVFDGLAARSTDLQERVLLRDATLRESHDRLVEQLDAWASWLISVSLKENDPSSIDTADAARRIQELSRERASIEMQGRQFRDRMSLLDHADQLLKGHWAEGHPNDCPVCSSDVSERGGITRVMETIRATTEDVILGLRADLNRIQESQRNLEEELQRAGQHTCPVSSDDQSNIRQIASRFIDPELQLEEVLKDQDRRRALRQDIIRVRVIPNPPTVHADPALESAKIAAAFTSLADQADRALEDPQAISEVKREFDTRMERVLRDHLPSTLGSVWKEISLSLTAAPWLLPILPSLTVESRGSALSVKSSDGSGRLIRYIFNAAERHVLGLSWFFTYFLTKKRFDDAWLLLDDPAQEMDQPSYRELVRFWETFLRLHRRANLPLTLILALHQEERALDAARALNARMYALGWKKIQRTDGEVPTVKTIALLAPGFHPLKPEAVLKEG